MCKNPFKIPQESPAFWKDSWECFMPYISLMQSPNLLIKLCMPYLKNLFWTNWTKSIDIQLKYFVNIFKVNHESFLTEIVCISIIFSLENIKWTQLKTLSAWKFSFNFEQGESNKHYCNCVLLLNMYKKWYILYKYHIYIYIQ